jgi:hypothetical protein
VNALLAIVLVLAAAQPEGPEPVRSEIVRGPVSVAVSVAPGAPRLSDEPVFTLEVASGPGVEVELPPFGESLGGFVVRDFREPAAAVVDGRTVVRQLYTLEPVETGKHVIRPITIAFTDATGRHEVTTDPLEIEVTSSLGDAAPDLADLRPPLAPRALPIERTVPWPALAAGAGGLVLLLALVLLLRRKRRAAAAVEPTPVERALAEFEALLDADPLARGDTAGFYVGMTAIVRRYVERTTGLRAPEQTTEEFLRAMRSHEAFDADRRERLRAFLESADLVKFAALRPARDDIGESFRRAQEFCDLPRALPLRSPKDAAA